ncbi:bifunctional folylpolyglutamate synthase/dihydrofolate synthase [Nicoliella spurrieriana]|uniref:Dihydrofolate synthase/folylpolyglutamate synthase n=1 Tax=Nicoliella spurrieriana TaxID=2925830 RepID=A0A976RS40_9LACO|nr:folylpolyglutamate synthase/dihydrofolate synthase family protein [Nicoliella spurrieriana]UQS86812.1 bifunctional folylpolyglutamate synthase/dihydrofolate synthase [Nicoliella spurrieriana]
MKSYQEALAYIHGRVKSHKDATMKRMQLLMDKLGHPEQQITAIHVAGTNGKGSVVSFLRNLLSEAGLTVGTFTSPFLVRFNERISVDGVPISDDEVVRLVKRVAPIVAEIDAMMPNEGPTEFEVLTAMMFTYFAEGHADVVIVEVGIGGDNDSTNVLYPDVSVITTIGYDHMQFLGNTLSEIAKHKAGIIKPNVPVVIGNIAATPKQVILNQATELSAPIKCLGRDFSVQSRPISGWHEQFDFSDGEINTKGLKMNMMGDFQIDNASVAIEAFVTFMRLHRAPVSAKMIKQGVLNTQWAGRFEKLNDQPLVVIDGAHNLPAIKEMQKNIQNHFSDREIYIILAILADKQYLQMIETLAGLKNVHLILTEFVGPNQRMAADLSTVRAEVKSAHPIEFIANWQEAILTVSNQMGQDDGLIITGSLYFISDVRALFKH